LTSGRAAWAGAILLVLVALTALVIPQTPLELEQRWAEWMHDLQTSALTHIALVFNSAGRGIVRALTIGVIGVLLLVARRWWGLVAFAVIESATPLANSTLKALVGRERPTGGLVHPTGSSFPSGHAAYAGATSVLLVLLFTAPGPRRRLWWSLAALAILGMAWSRTYLQVHWLVDVTAGSTLGVGIALVTLARSLPSNAGYAASSSSAASGSTDSGSV
jgi:undecaprenyl-diphosphatase